MSIGLMDIRSYDDAVVASLCARLDTGENRYFVQVPGLKSASGQTDAPRVPVFFSIASQADIFPKFTLPAFIVRRVGYQFSRKRWFVPSVGLYQPASDATPVEVNGVSGYDKYEAMMTFAPVDVMYTVDAVARYMSDANVLTAYMMKRLRTPFSTIYVLDSVGDAYVYEYRLGEVTDVSQLVDITEKIIGTSMPLTVEGELPVSEPVEVTAVTQVVERFHQFSEEVPLS